MANKLCEQRWTIREIDTNKIEIVFRLKSQTQMKMDSSQRYLEKERERRETEGRRKSVNIDKVDMLAAGWCKNWKFMGEQKGNLLLQQFNI